ncbi:hypothetical protein KFR76_01400 [Corynebacterium diphtheriae]|nr:hypothetical protein KFR76_01400 [Corynebacterium diphtheriae]
MRRPYHKLDQFDGKIFFFGQEKPLGPVSTTKESSQDRDEHCLIQAITRLGTYASQRDEKILAIMDSTDTDNRERAVASLGRTIYSTQNHDTNAVIEVPIQADSHLYGTLQLAD